MDWTIILCLVFTNVFASQGDDLRRLFLAGDSSKLSSLDYFRFGDQHIPDTHLREISPGRTLLRASIYPLADRKKHRMLYRKSNDLPNLLRNYLERRLNKLADKRRSTLTQHSEEFQENVLPPSEPARPGHTLLQPTKTMLKSSAKYPRTDGVSLVYGSQDNLGIIHGNTPSRVLYSDFRKDNLADLLMNVIQDQNSARDLRRSGNLKKKVAKKKKTLKGKNTKKGEKLKRLDTNRNQIYHSDYDSSIEMQNSNNNVASKTLKNKKKLKQYDQRTRKDLKETKTRVFQSAGNFGSYRKKPSSKFNKKRKKQLSYEKNANIHSKIVEKLNEKLDQKLKLSKLKKMVPLDEYKKQLSKRPKKKPPLLIRQSNDYDVSSIDSHSRENRLKYVHNQKSSSSEESSYSRENKKHKKTIKKVLKRSKKKQIYRQRESDGSAESENQKYEKESDEKKPKDENSDKKKPKDKNGGNSKEKKNTDRLVYGSPDNYGIVWAKTPYRTMYTDFRRTTNLLSKILEAYHSYKRNKNLKKALVAIKVWPLEKTKVNQDNIDKTHNQVLDSNSNEILDDESIDIDVKVADYRKRSKKAKIKSAFRNRDDSYDKGNATEDCQKSDEEEESDDSDYEKNPGNPYTLFKNKYKQNWPWHFELGDHINLNQFGPEFNNQGGPSGADLFFNRKWWYFNQDDYIPFR